MKNFLRLMFNILMIAVVIACQSAGQSTDNSMLKPGDSIHGMTLTQGAASAAPLWAFCSSDQESKEIVAVDCRVPLLPRLAVGNIFMPTGESLTELGGSEITWELSIDDQIVDLDAFGTYDFVLPTMAHAPSPVREVFTKFTAWDVVLTNMKPGAHILHCMAQAETETYSWNINFTIEGPGSME